MADRERSAASTPRLRLAVAVAVVVVARLMFVQGAIAPSNEGNSGHACLRFRFPRHFDLFLRSRWLVYLLY